MPLNEARIREALQNSGNSPAYALGLGISQFMQEYDKPAGKAGDTAARAEAVLMGMQALIEAGQQDTEPSPESRAKADRIVFNTIDGMNTGATATEVRSLAARILDGMSPLMRQQIVEAGHGGAATTMVLVAANQAGVSATLQPVMVAPPANTEGFFDRDAFGLIGIQRRFGGISNEEHAERSGGALSFGERFFGSSMSYRQMQSIGYAEIMTMSHVDFQRTEFARYGLDLATTQYLYQQGFTAPQIMTAAADTKALGFSAKDTKMVTNFAVVNDYDPEGRAERNASLGKLQDWKKKDEEKFNRLQNNVLNSEEGTPQHERALAEWQAYVREGYRKSGVQKAADRLCTPRPGAAAAETAAACQSMQGITDGVLGITEMTTELQVKLGDEAIADMSLEDQKGATPGATARGADQAIDRHDPSLNSVESTSVPTEVETAARDVFGKPKSSAEEPASAEAAQPSTAPAHEEPKPPGEQLPLPKKGPGPAP